jgi:hypothetical protein
MRLFVAEPNQAFLLHLSRLLKRTPVGNAEYAVTVGLPPDKVFKGLCGDKVCIVVPGQDELRLRLEAQGDKYVLHCPPSTSYNSHGLTRAVLSTLRGAEVDVVVLPMLGEDAVDAARGMYRALAEHFLYCDK